MAPLTGQYGLVPEARLQLWTTTRSHFSSFRVSRSGIRNFEEITAQSPGAPAIYQESTGSSIDFSEPPPA